LFPSVTLLGQEAVFLQHSCLLPSAFFDKKLANYQESQSKQSEFHQHDSDVDVLLQQTISESRQSNIKRFAQALKQEDKSTDFLEIDTHC
jgi:hypothetical protein